MIRKRAQAVNYVNPHGNVFREIWGRRRRRGGGDAAGQGGHVWRPIRTAVVPGTTGPG